jgi:hypothetical protein
VSSAAAGLGEKRRVHRYASSGAEWGEKAVADPAPGPRVLRAPRDCFVRDFLAMTRNLAVRQNDGDVQRFRNAVP